MPTYSRYSGAGGGTTYTFVGVAPITITNVAGTVTVSMTQSNATTDGWLSFTDWNTFNSKQSALTFGNLTEATSGVLTITGGTGAVIGSGTTIQVSQSSSLTSGYLSSTDWSTFNSKQPAGNYITALTGEVTATGPGSVAATITNSAVTNAKLANMPTLTIKGNNTGSPAAPLDLTATQTTAILDVMVGDSGTGGTKGLVPAPAAGDTAAGKYLGAAGTWTVPTGTGANTTLSNLTNPTAINQNLNLGSNAISQTNYIISPQLYDEGTKTGNFTLNWTNGPAQKVTINAAGPLVITLSNPVTGGSYIVRIEQGATPGTVTWPSSVKWGTVGAPTLSNATGEVDIISLFYDGTDYRASALIQDALPAANYSLTNLSFSGSNGQFLTLSGGVPAWASVFPASVAGDVDKVLAVDAAGARSWQYAGLGAGSLGTNNVIVGRSKPSSITTANNSILIGSGSGNALSTSTDIVAIGTNSLAAITTGGTGNVAVGSLSGQNLTADLNTSVGYAAMQGTAGSSTTAGSTAVGWGALRYVTTGIWNTMVGFSAGAIDASNRITTGQRNSGYGAYALGGNITGQYNIGIGFGAHSATLSGNFNIVIGNNSCNPGAGKIGFGSGAGNILIGDEGQPNATNTSYGIGLGYRVQFGANEFAVGSSTAQINTMLLGRGGADQTAANAVKIQTMRAAGTNIDLSVGALTLAGSQSTGNAAGGDVIIATASAGASGSTLNAHVERIRAKAATEVVVNDTGVDFDFRVEGDTDANLLMVDAGTDRVGIGTSTPSDKLDVNGNIAITGTARRITADFSNATQSSRCSFVSSTTNGNTIIQAIPNGTATTCSYSTYNNSDVANSSVAQILVSSTEASIRSSITGTGSYLPMTFLNGGSERMRLDTAGNLGIGTSSPSSTLHLRKDANALTVIEQIQNRDAGASAGGVIAFINSANDLSDNRYAYIGAITTGAAQNGNHLVFAPNATGNSAVEAMRITSAGNVGIGTSTPSGKLNVAQGDLYVTRTDDLPLVSIISRQAAGYKPAQVQMVRQGASQTATPNDSTLGEIRFDGLDTNAAYMNCAMIQTVIGTNAAGGAPASLLFYTAASGASATERMRITNTGDVGIGTTTPENVANFNTLTLNGTTGGAVYCRNNGTNKLRILCDSGAGYVYAMSGTPLLFGANDTERMRITSGGEVYIAGTTDQGAYNLQCNGTGVWGAGAYVNGSDRRLKENIQDLESGLDVVEKLKPVTFQYKEDYSKDTGIQPGFIAQDLQEALVGKDYLNGIVQAGPNFLNVAYQNLIPILAKAIQELKEISSAQAARIAELETKLNATPE